MTAIAAALAGLIVALLWGVPTGVAFYVLLALGAACVRAVRP